MNTLEYLADLLRVRNATERALHTVLQRPGSIGDIGEVIAQAIFPITLHERRNHPGSDGWFHSGPLEDKTVNVKMYSNGETRLDIKPSPPWPDYYLVFRGAKASKQHGIPWQIADVFLYDAAVLIPRLQRRGTRLTVATSLRQSDRDEAQIYPPREESLFVLTEGQIEQIRLFA